MVILFDAEALFTHLALILTMESGEKWLTIDKAYEKFQEGLDKIFAELEEQVEVDKFIVCNQVLKVILDTIYLKG